MSKEEKIEETSCETDPEKAEDEEFRNFKEEPGDDDGENRHPELQFSLQVYSLQKQ